MSNVSILLLYWGVGHSVIILQLERTPPLVPYWVMNNVMPYSLRYMAPSGWGTRVGAAPPPLEKNIWRVFFGLPSLAKIYAGAHSSVSTCHVNLPL